MIEAVNRAKKNFDLLSYMGLQIIGFNCLMGSPMIRSAMQMLICIA